MQELTCLRNPSSKFIIASESWLENKGIYYLCSNHDSLAWLSDSMLFCRHLRTWQTAKYHERV